ncbi:MAG: helicase C-terminal domain-containing protein [Candidatus Methanofastidiosia archaeon]
MDCFPYQTLRNKQEEFITFAREGVTKGTNLVIEAPTGFGKTSCILASVLPIAREKNKKIVYLCRTHKQMDRVIEELKLINKETPVSAVSLRGRKEMCLSPLVLNHTQDSSSSMYVCRLLKKMKRCQHYQNTKENEDKAYGMEIVFSKKPTFSHEIKKACQNEIFCPYEIAKNIAGNTEVIACSYLYLFHPDIREGFLEGIGVDLQDIIVVMDEAHNLPELAIDLGSSRLSLSSLKSAIRESTEYNEEGITRFLDFTYQAIVSLDSKYGLDAKEETRILPIELISKFFGKGAPFLKEKTIATFEEFIGYMLKQGEEIQKEMLKKGKTPRSFIHSVASFLYNWITLRQRDDFCFLLVKYITKAGSESLRIEIIDLDPRNITTQVTDTCFSVVAMSGTLSPLVAFADTIGMKNYKTKIFPSPFDRSNILVIGTKGVTTKGTHRNLEMYRKIASKAAEVTNNTPKNVAIFTPSYEVLEGLLSAGIRYIIEKPMFIESRELSSQENDEMIRRFKNYEKHGGGVLLGVLGGRNAEGQDYPGDEMNCVVIVGVPYARPTSRVKAQIEYYKKVFPTKGSYYGYYLPAHRKLNQGAGRAHRKLDDRAAIVFLDHRTTQPFVKKDISEWIKKEMRIVEDKPGTIGKMIKLFFDAGTD